MAFIIVNLSLQSDFYYYYYFKSKCLCGNLSAFPQSLRGKITWVEWNICIFN